MVKRIAVFAAMAFAAACNPVADAKYQGQPLVTLQGTIGLASPSVVPTNPSVAVVWFAELDAGASAFDAGAIFGVPSFVGEVAPVSATSFPANFQFQIFDPPPAAAFFAPADAGAYAFGYVIAVDDVNGDGQFALTSSYVTGTPSDAGGCLVPGNWVSVYSGGSIQCTNDGCLAYATCDAFVIGVAAPDQLLGVSPDFSLLYVAGEATPIAPFAAGYNVTSISCEPDGGETRALVADTTPLDIQPPGSQNLLECTPSTDFALSACPPGAGACNAIVNSGPVVDEWFVLGTPPVAQGGGVPPPGTYVLTASAAFATGFSGLGVPYQGTVVVGAADGNGNVPVQRSDGPAVQSCSDNDSTPMTSTGVFGFQVAGNDPTQLSFTWSCNSNEGGPGQSTLGYTLSTAGGVTTLQLFEGGGEDEAVSTYSLL